jgi:hypothetical protein
VGQVSTLTFTIVNTASAVAATALDFTDNLPAGVEVASPPNASTTCTGGTITAVAATGTIAYTGGSVAAGASCNVTVDVTAAAPGTHLNTSGALTSSSGSSGTASDVLTAEPLPLFSKSFTPDAIDPNGVTTLTFTIDNSASAVDATGIGFVDNLPPGMTVADPANAATDCVGGTLTASPGASVISYTGGTVLAGTTCTIEVDVTASQPGTLVNTTEDLTSSLGNSGPASAPLTVAAATSILEIPTLDRWALLLLALLLALPAAWILRR